ncbi:MAG: hypothetical protein JRI80_03920 [Deltaproteobacteria bacterium]|nr:hypothetical protein [Deltaproteobacteria bacterium]
MAEIRSTLDIIMEKTRGLTMTEEEKTVMRDRELEGKTRGLVQKYLDGAIPMATFRKEWDQWGKDQEKALPILTRMCIENVEPEEENARLFELLQEVAGVDTGLLNRVLDRSREDLETKRLESRERIRKALAASGITGSAIFPNLEADPEWKETVSETRQKLRAELRSCCSVK